MKNVIATLIFLALVIPTGCGVDEEELMGKANKLGKADPEKYDPNRGLGRYDTFELPATLDSRLAEEGESIAQTKCMACHRTSKERLVGPGWDGVTQRRTPQWLMNFIVDPDPMIDVDPALQQQLELCLTRMPNQDVSDDEARRILEFMRKIDGVQ